MLDSTSTPAAVLTASTPDVLVRHTVDVLRSLGDDSTPFRLVYGTTALGILVSHQWEGSARGLLLTLTDRHGAARPGIRVLSIGRAS